MNFHPNELKHMSYNYHLNQPDLTFNSEHMNHVHGEILNQIKLRNNINATNSAMNNMNSNNNNILSNIANSNTNCISDIQLNSPNMSFSSENLLKRSFLYDKTSNNNTNMPRNINQLQFSNPLFINQINQPTANVSAFNAVYQNKPESVMSFGNGFNYGYTHGNQKFPNHSKDALKHQLYSDFLAAYREQHHPNSSMDHLNTFYDSDAAAKAAAISYSNMISDANPQMYLNDMSELFDHKLKMEKIKATMMMMSKDPFNFKRAKISNSDPQMIIHQRNSNLKRSQFDTTTSGADRVEQHSNEFMHSNDPPNNNSFANDFGKLL